MIAGRSPHEVWQLRCACFVNEVRGPEDRCDDLPRSQRSAGRQHSARGALGRSELRTACSLPSHQFGSLCHGRSVQHSLSGEA
jgi:hypothetical protein